MIVCPIGLAEGRDCDSFMLVGQFTQHVDRNGAEREGMFTTPAEDPITCNEHDEEAFMLGDDAHVFDVSPGVTRYDGPRPKWFDWSDLSATDVERSSFERRELIEGIEKHNAALSPTSVGDNE